MPLNRIPFAWGLEAGEAALAFPCDALIPDPGHVYFRAITVNAPAPAAFRWLCQMKEAPYSYDWIDNFGRKSPPRLLEGLERLEAGQRVMTIFSLVSFEKDRHLTLLMSSPGAVALFGLFAITYRLIPAGEGATRLVVKLLVRYNRGLNGLLMRTCLPWGDWIMMRKQLKVLKALSEGGAGVPRGGRGAPA